MRINTVAMFLSSNKWNPNVYRSLDRAFMFFRRGLKHLNHDCIWKMPPAATEAFKQRLWNKVEHLMSNRPETSPVSYSWTQSLR